MQLSYKSEGINADTVTKVFAALRLIMDEKEAALKEQIQRIEARRKRMIDAYQSQLKQAREGLRENKTHFESIVSANEHVKLLQINEQLTAYLNRLTVELDDLLNPVKVKYQIKGLDQLQMAVDNSLKETIILEQLPGKT